MRSKRQSNEGLNLRTQWLPVAHKSISNLEHPADQTGLPCRAHRLTYDSEPSLERLSREAMLLALGHAILRMAIRNGKTVRRRS